MNTGSELSPKEGVCFQTSRPSEREHPGTQQASIEGLSHGQLSASRAGTQHERRVGICLHLSENSQPRPPSGSHNCRAHRQVREQPIPPLPCFLQESCVAGADRDASHVPRPWARQVNPTCHPLGPHCTFQANIKAWLRWLPGQRNP